VKNSELSRKFQAIKNLFQQADDACGEDIEMMSHWARYLCVLSAGFLENALGVLYIDVCRREASENVARFAIGTLKKISNPKTRRFLDVAGEFRKEWREQLQMFVDEDGRAEAIDSIMTNRHLIAHGQRSDISLARVKDYLLKSARVVEFIEEQCK
jgi:hypothetical protein